MPNMKANTACQCQCDSVCSQTDIVNNQLRTTCMVNHWIALNSKYVCSFSIKEKKKKLVYHGSSH
jgi:hypothetical protein